MKLFYALLLTALVSTSASAARSALWRIHWTDPNTPRCSSYQVYRDGVLCATVTDTVFTDSTATHGVRHVYWLTSTRNGKTSGPSTKRAYALALDWTQGATDTMRRYQSNDPLTLLLVALPYSRWTINWVYNVSSERVIGHCDYDYDFNNEDLDLSDFCFFSRHWTLTPVAQRPDELRRFGSGYGLQERMEYSK